MDTSIPYTAENVLKVDISMHKVNLRAYGCCCASCWRILAGRRHRWDRSRRVPTAAECRSPWWFPRHPLCVWRQRSLHQLGSIWRFLGSSQTSGRLGPTLWNSRALEMWPDVSMKIRASAHNVCLRLIHHSCSSRSQYWTHISVGITHSSVQILHFEMMSSSVSTFQVVIYFCSHCINLLRTPTLNIEFLWNGTFSITCYSAEVHRFSYVSTRVSTKAVPNAVQVCLVQALRNECLRQPGNLVRRHSNVRRWLRVPQRFRTLAPVSQNQIVRFLKVGIWMHAWENITVFDIIGALLTSWSEGFNPMFCFAITVTRTKCLSCTSKCKHPVKFAVPLMYINAHCKDFLAACVVAGELWTLTLFRSSSFITVIQVDDSTSPL